MLAIVITFLKVANPTLIVTGGSMHITGILYPQPLSNATQIPEYTLLLQNYIVRIQILPNLPNPGKTSTKLSYKT